MKEGAPRGDAEGHLARVRALRLEGRLAEASAELAVAAELTTGCEWPHLIDEVLCEEAELEVAKGGSGLAQARLVCERIEQRAGVDARVDALLSESIRAREMRWYAAGVELARRADLLIREAGGDDSFSVGRLAVLLVLGRQYAEAVVVGQRHLAAAQRSESKGIEVIAFANLAEAYGGVGDFAAAVRALDAVIAIFMEVNPGHRALPPILERRAEFEAKRVNRSAV